MTQLALFPTKYVNITQKWGSGTHKNGFPIDVAGKDAGIDNFFAPFDAVVKKIWNNGNTVWLESVNPVQFADGTVDYAVVSFTHDNYIADLAVGKSLSQGQVFYQEGTAGNATGNHVHIECARGKFSGTGWYQAANGQWVINNPYQPDSMLSVTQGNVIIQTLGLNFKQGGEMPIPNADNYYNRYRKAMQYIRGRDMSREEFNKNFVGNSDLGMLEAMLDSPEADTQVDYANWGRTAKNDNWQGQIAGLQTQVAELGKRPSAEQLAALQKQVDDLAASSKKATEERDKLAKQAAEDKAAGDTVLRRLGQFFTKYIGK